MTTVLRSHDWRWKPGGGYYTAEPEILERDPRLPDLRIPRDAEMARLFDEYLPDDRTPEVLELGCGASQWLPYLALRKGCRVSGLDREASAVDLAMANMRGAGARGDILCRDAFVTAANADLLGRFDLVYSRGLLEHFADIVDCLRRVRPYLRPDGIILTTVPNLQGVNWTLQRFGDLRVLETHVVYDVELLRRRHEEAGFDSLAAGYLGSYDAFLSESAPGTARWRRMTHGALCRASSVIADRCRRMTYGRAALRGRWFAPYVYYVGRADGADAPDDGNARAFPSCSARDYL